MEKRISILISILLIFLSVLITQNSVKGDSQYIGSEACKDCHGDYYKSFIKSIHNKRTILGTPVNRDGCESCHGPGAQHAEKGGGRGVAILAFGRKVDAKAKSSMCLKCHEESKQMAFWDMSKHKSASISCDHCHTIHSMKEKNLKVSDPELCFGCHTAIKVRANKQSRHPIREGKTRCYACHDPHGSFGEKMVKADTVNELCYKCHAEKRGPFMW